ncbi:hypothetical protein EGW08_020258, partial [Elysia chlorotica]
SWSESFPTKAEGPKSSLGSSRSCTAQRVDDAGQEVEVTLQLAGGRAHAQVQTAGQHVQTSERSGSGGVGALAGSELTPALGSAAIGTATSRGTRLGAHAAYSVAQVAENLRKAAGLLLDGALGVTDVSAGGCVGHGGQHGDKSEDCERVHD